MDTNKFSFDRIKLMVNYYKPAIIKQLIVYTIIIVAIFIAGIISEVPYWFSGLFVMVFGLGQTLFGYLFYLSPIAFDRYDDPVLNTLLPAKGNEKASFVIVYNLVFVPVFIFLLLSLCNGVLLMFPELEIESLLIGDSMDKFAGLFGSSWRFWLYEISGFFWMTSAVLYVVTVSRSNKVIKAILTTILLPIAVGLIALLGGFIIGLANITWVENIVDIVAQIGDKDEAVPFILDHISTFIFSYQAIMVVIGIVLVYLTWRHIAHRQV